VMLRNKTYNKPFHLEHHKATDSQLKRLGVSFLVVHAFTAKLINTL